MNKFYLLILALILTGLLYLLAPILTPFLIGALLAYLVDPLVRKLMRLHLSRVMAMIIVFVAVILVFVSLMLLLVPLIEMQIVTLAQVIPNVVIWVQANVMPWLDKHFGIQDSFSIDAIKTTLAENWTKAGNVVGWAVKTVFHSSVTFFAWIANLVLIPVVTFYLLRDWDKVIQGIRRLLPRHIEPTVVKLTQECNEVLSSFFRGQLLVMLSLGAIYSAGLMIVGVNISLTIGVIAGLMSIVPYLGFIVGITIASVATFIQFGSFYHVVLVWLVFAIGQVTESVFLTPKLVGHRIGLHPVAVIFAVLAGGTLFGFFGVLLALPVAAVIMVMLRHLDRRYRNSHLYRW